MTDLVAAIPGDYVVLDGESAQWRSLDGSRRERVNSAEAAALQSCATFAPRDVHVQRLAREYGWSPQQSGSLLAALEARSLVRDVDAFIGPLDPSPVEALPPPLVAIRTYQRPDGLRVLLDSLLADERRHGATRRYAIVDDTRDREHAANTYALAAAFAAESRSEVEVLGLDERDAALAVVLADAPERSRDAVRSMLDPAQPSAVTGSRTWNWAVLLAAGGALSILDDDTRFPLRTFPGARRAADLLDATETLVRWYDDVATLERELPPIDRDPYEALSEVVGQPVRALLARDGVNAGTLVHRSPRELAAIVRNARTIGAVPGTWGTITLDSSVYLSLPTESIAELFRAPYRHARLAADRVAQGYAAPRVTSFALYTPLLMDARAPLPFAGTWGRVDDTYFLMLLRAIAPDAAYLHVPAMLGHADYAVRDRLARSRERIPLDRNAFVASLFAGIGESLGPGGDRGTRLAAVGHAFAALAEAEARTLEDRVLRWREEMAGRVTRHLANGLRQYPDAPPEWREHVARIVAVNRDALIGDRVESAEVEALRRALRQVADVAPAWPVVWDAARARASWPTRRMTQ